MQELDNELNKRGWSRSELARRSGITHESLSLIYSGKRKPGVQLCRAVAAALNLPPTLVFRWAGLLPEEAGIDPELEEFIHIYQQLPKSKRDELLANGRWFLEYHGQSEEQGINRRTKQANR